MVRQRELEDPIRMDIRLTSEMRGRVDRWRGQLPDVPGRNEAIRRLIEIGLSAQVTANEAA